MHLYNILTVGQFSRKLSHILYEQGGRGRGFRRPFMANITHFLFSLHPISTLHPPHSHYDLLNSLLHLARLPSVHHISLHFTHSPFVDLLISPPHPSSPHSTAHLHSLSLKPLAPLFSSQSSPPIFYVTTSQILIAFTCFPHSFTKFSLLIPICLLFPHPTSSPPLFHLCSLLCTTTLLLTPTTSLSYHPTHLFTSSPALHLLTHLFNILPHLPLLFTFYLPPPAPLLSPYPLLSHLHWSA